jgi:large subunit ribosomal protein L22
MESPSTKRARDPKAKRRTKKRVRAEQRRFQRPKTMSLGHYVRISPQKVRLVCDEIRGKLVEDALSVLEFTPRKGAKLVAKVLRSGIANAENNRSLDVDTLFVKRIEVGPGPTLKRFLPRAQGRATPLLKRTSHITIVLDQKGAE